MKLEKKLSLLAECGITLNEPFAASDLVSMVGRTALEERGWGTLLACLGVEHESAPFLPHCVQLWNMDLECIDGTGSYVDVAKRISLMTQGSLPLVEIRDHVDVAGGKAWLSFKCKGKRHRIDCKVDSDWIDVAVFGHFVELLDTHAPRKQFVYYHEGGQDLVVGCVTRAHSAKLRKLIRRLKPME